MNDLRSPLAKRLDEFRESEQGRKLMDWRTLGSLDGRDAQWLRRRIEAAFIAGWDGALDLTITKALDAGLIDTNGKPVKKRP